MILYPSCDYYHERRFDEFSPGDGECNECYRWEICIAAFMKDLRPIPLDRLHEYKGKEVWVQTPGIPQYGRKAVVEDVDVSKRVLWLVNDFTCHNYGQTWEAYEVSGSLPCTCMA